MTRAQRIWPARVWLLLSLVLAGALAFALVRRHRAEPRSSATERTQPAGTVGARRTS